MNLLIFLDTDRESGPTRLAIDFAEQAQRLGHRICMVGLVRGRAEPENDFTRSVHTAGLELRMLRERFRFDPTVAFQFRRLLKELKPDVYVSNGYKGSVLGVVAHRHGVCWQAIFHGFTWENRLVRCYHALDVRLMRNADEVVAVSPAFERALARRGVPTERLRWVPNAISARRLETTRSQNDLRRHWFGQEADRVVVAGVIGRFSPEKGPEHFVAAFAQAHEEFPELRGVLVGEGPTLNACRERAEWLAVAEHLVFPGFRTDLASVYAAIDLLVIPSFSEGLPTVLLEAMISGVPTASTRVGAVPDIMRDGHTALLAPVGDVEALAEAMGRLARDPQLRRTIAGNAAELVRNRLSVEQRARTLLEHAEHLKRGDPPPLAQWTEE